MWITSLLALVCIIGQVLLNPITTCPTYVQEGSFLNCQCTSSSPSSGVFSWPGHSHNATLIKTVDRGMNGTSFTCQQQLSGQNTSVVYVLQVAYGPSDGDVTVTGPTGFIANGSQLMTVTCGVSNVNPGVTFSFLFSGTVTKACESKPAPNVCVFRPVPQDDGGKVICTVTNIFSGTSITRADASFILHLQYPPPGSPVVLPEPSDDHPLSHGDVITCTVTGGQPLVTSINFHCVGPTLSDQTDVTNNFTRTVSSSVTVDTRQATRSRMDCVCQAVWGPDTNKYTVTVTKSYLLTYQATITSFTVNGRSSSVIVESNDPILTLTCNSSGRPPPYLTLYKVGNGTALASATGGSVSYVIMQGRCEDTGSYRCDAGNGVWNGSTQLVTVSVVCSPRIQTSNVDFQSGSGELTGAGLAFTLISNPAPHIFTFTYHRNGVSGAPALAQFNTSCLQDSEKTFLFYCRLVPVEVSVNYLGSYVLAISNSIGNGLQLRFSVLNPVVPTTTVASTTQPTTTVTTESTPTTPATTSTTTTTTTTTTITTATTAPSSVPMWVYYVVAGVGAVVVIALAVALVVCCCRRAGLRSDSVDNLSEERRVYHGIPDGIPDGTHVMPTPAQPEIVHQPVARDNPIVENGGIVGGAGNGPVTRQRPVSGRSDLTHLDVVYGGSHSSTEAGSGGSQGSQMNPQQPIGHRDRYNTLHEMRPQAPGLQNGGGGALLMVPPSRPGMQSSSPAGGGGNQTTGSMAGSVPSTATVATSSPVTVTPPLVTVTPPPVTVTSPDRQLPERSPSPPLPPPPNENDIYMFQS